MYPNKSHKKIVKGNGIDLRGGTSNIQIDTAMDNIMETYAPNFIYLGTFAFNESSFMKLIK